MNRPKQLNQDSSEQERPLLKFFWLTLLKESWLLLANSYGFLVHPYLTLRKVGRDRSQLAIFASLWLGTWLGILLVLVLTFLVIPWLFPRLIWIKKYGLRLSFLGAITVGFFTLYLLYWLYIIRFKRKEDLCR